MPLKKVHFSSLPKDGRTKKMYLKVGQHKHQQSFGQVEDSGF